MATKLFALNIALVLLALGQRSCSCTGLGEVVTGNSALATRLAAVCSESPESNSQQVFTSPARVLELIGEFERQQQQQQQQQQEQRQGAACPARFADAFAKLKWLLDSKVVLSDVCGSQAFERIRDFHMDFISLYAPELARDQLEALKRHQQHQQRQQRQQRQQQRAALKPIPPALKQFFVAFAMQVNAACKQQLVARIERSSTLVNDDDFAVIGHYKRESSRLGLLRELKSEPRPFAASVFGRSASAASDFNELEILDFSKARSERDALKLAQLGATETTALDKRDDADQNVDDNSNVKSTDAADDDDDGSKLYVQVRFDDNLRRVKEACSKRFMPVYMELFAPVIRLNNLGYADKLNTKIEDRELTRRSDITRWFDIIQTCEVLKDIEILHDSSAMQAIVGIILDDSHLHATSRVRGSATTLQSPPQSSSATSIKALGRDIKLLSRVEANQLMESERRARKAPASNAAAAFEGAIEPRYNPQIAQIEHAKLQFTPRMWLTDERALQKQVGEFDRALDVTIRRKTNALRLLKQDIMIGLRTSLALRKNQILERDQESSLGRLALFIHRHRALVKGVKIVMTLLLVMAHLGLG